MAGELSFNGSTPATPEQIAAYLTAHAAAGGATAAQLRNEGWAIIATNPAMLAGGQNLSATPFDRTYRTRHVATADASRVALVYANFTQISVSVSEPYNDLQVGAVLQKAGSSPGDMTGFQVPVTFGGRLDGTVGRGALSKSEGAFFDVAKNEAFFVNTHVSNFQANGPSAAPTLTEGLTGGTLVGGSVYYVCTVYVFADGSESATSAGAGITVTTGASTRSIIVTSPADLAGAVGWRAYMTGRNGTLAGQYFRYPLTAKLGSSLTIVRENLAFNTRQVRAGGLASVVGGGAIVGGTNFGGLDTGEGFIDGDATFKGVSITQQGANLVYSPVALIGKVKGAPPPTVALIGDSIQAGTGDHGFVQACGGHGTRALTDQMALCFSKATAPLYGYVRVPLGGEQVAQYAAALNTNQYSHARHLITDLASNVMSNYGTNDTGDSLANMKANTLRVATWHISRGQKFFQKTILPAINSTDFFTTLAGQTPQATEATRVGFNDWLRDTSANGFKAQAGGKLVEVIDICKYTEVNSAGVLTLNGGLWRMPPTTVFASGTLTAVTSGAEFTDSALAATPAQTWKGYNVLFTSGAAAGRQGCILWQNNGTINISSTAGATPAVGDTYQIRLFSMIDGKHPASQGYIWAAQAIQEALPLLQS